MDFFVHIRRCIRGEYSEQRKKIEKIISVNSRKKAQLVYQRVHVDNLNTNHFVPVELWEVLWNAHYARLVEQSNQERIYERHLGCDKAHLFSC